MDLDFKNKLKLVRQKLFVAMNHQSSVSVSIDELGGLYQIDADGHKVYVPSALRWKMYRYGWGKRLERLRSEYAFEKFAPIDDSSVIIDIGANVGEFAFVANEKDASCYCVEPDPLVNLCAKLNTQNLVGVKVFDDVLWNANEPIDFNLAPQRADSSVFGDSSHAVKKQAITLKSFMEREGLERVDFIKCDAEGAEPEVLQGVGDAYHKIGVCAFDTGAERDGKRTDKECRAIFESWGFRVLDERVGTRLMTYGVNPKF